MPAKPDTGVRGQGMSIIQGQRGAQYGFFIRIEDRSEVDREYSNLGALTNECCKIASEA